MSFQEQVYDLLFNGPPLTADQIVTTITDPPTNAIRRLWFKVPGIRVYKKDHDPGIYFMPNKASDPKRYTMLYNKYHR